MACRFLTVDVFTNKIFDGAQIAVVPNAEQLSPELMQKIAAELNLWRTVFILPTTTSASFTLRIFNNKKEFNFGGHATIGVIHALAQLKVLDFIEGKNEFTLNEGYGEILCSVEIDNGKPIFHQFTSKAKVEIDRFTPTLEELGDFLSIAPFHFDVQGYSPLLVASHLPYLFVPVDNFASLSDIHFDYKAWTASSAPATLANAIFLFSVSENNGNKHFHCRLVGPNFGLHEDPPIGAAMPAFAGYLGQFYQGQYPVKFIAERGAFAGRKSELHVEIITAEQNGVELNVGGEAVLVSQGELYI